MLCVFCCLYDCFQAMSYDVLDLHLDVCVSQDAFGVEVVQKLTFRRSYNSGGLKLFLGVSGCLESISGCFSFVEGC